MKSEPEGRCIGRDSDKDLTDLLAFGAEDSETDVGAGAIA